MKVHNQAVVPQFISADLVPFKVCTVWSYPSSVLFSSPIANTCSKKENLNPYTDVMALLNDSDILHLFY